MQSFVQFQCGSPSCLAVAAGSPKEVAAVLRPDLGRVRPLTSLDVAWHCIVLQWYLTGIVIVIPNCFFVIVIVLVIVVVIVIVIGFGL